jgi:hypothetical protein
MANHFHFFCTTQTQAGSDLVLDININSKPTQLQVICVTGTILIEGESGEILGVPTAPIVLTDGMIWNFNEISYVEAKITILDGTTYQLASNE